MHSRDRFLSLLVPSGEESDRVRIGVGRKRLFTLVLKVGRGQTERTFPSSLTPKSIALGDRL